LYTKIKLEGMEGHSFHRLSDCEPGLRAWVKDANGVRWTKENGWTVEQINYPHEGRLVFAYPEQSGIPGVWTQKNWTENPIARDRETNELYYADYWSIYEDEKGGVPDSWRSHLMYSNDGGRSWERRGSVSLENEVVLEPMVALNASGDLVCVARGNKTMHISYSKDKGYTWSAPKPIFGYGVLPQLLQLDNGVMVLCFGRTGIWGANDYETVLMFSTDGGYTWPAAETALRESLTDSPIQCGYTSLLALDGDSFLLGYNGAQTRFADKDGVVPPEARKQLLVRKITAEVE